MYLRPTQWIGGWILKLKIQCLTVRLQKDLQINVGLSVAHILHYTVKKKGHTYSSLLSTTQNKYEIDCRYLKILILALWIWVHWDL